MRGTITVATRAAVLSGLVDGDALISIRASNPDDAFEIDGGRFPGGVLALAFDDVPADRFVDRRGNEWIGPTQAQVGLAMRFGADALVRGERLVVHCLHGKSRSPATALAVLCQFVEPAEAVAHLLAQDSEERMCFNQLVVRHAEDILGRDDIGSTLSAMCPRWLTWREFWRRQGVEL